MGKFKVKGGVFGGSPFPMVETDFQKNVSAFSNVMKSFEDMRKQRYDKELFNKIVSDMNKKQSTSELEKTMKQIRELSVDNVTGEQKTVNQSKLMELVMSTQNREGTPEAEAMMTSRLSGENRGGVGSRFLNLFNPAGSYTGAPTSLEQGILSNSMNRETPLEQLSKKAIIMKNLSSALEQEKVVPTEYDKRRAEGTNLGLQGQPLQDFIMYGTRPPAEKTTYSSDVISASNLLDMKPEDVKAEHIIRAKEIEKNIGQGKLNSGIFSQARNLAFSQLGGSSMMGLSETQQSQLLPKTIEIYNQLMALENPEGGGQTTTYIEGETYTDAQGNKAIYQNGQFVPTQ